MSCNIDSVPLFQLSDGRFQLIKDGPISPFMCGPGYYLIEKDLVDFLLELDISGTRFESATIWHRSLDIEYRGYFNMLVEHFIDNSSLNELDTNGLKFFSMNDTFLFVTPRLKQILTNSPFSYLRFSEGFSEFV